MMRMVLVFFTSGTVTTCELAAREKDCLVTSPCHNAESLLFTTAVPQRRTDCETGEQIGVQGDDIGHRHERGQARQDLCPDGGAVLFQLKDFFHSFPLSLITGSHKGPPLL